MQSLDLNSLIKLAKLFPPDNRTHYSLILYKNRIVGVGMENRGKTHPKAAELGYKYPTIHSELAAYMNMSDKGKAGDSMLVNLRVTPTGKVGMSKPCKYCMGWVTTVFGDIWYTNQDGVFERL